MSTISITVYIYLKDIELTSPKKEKYIEQKQSNLLSMILMIKFYGFSLASLLTNKYIKKVFTGNLVTNLIYPTLMTL